MGYAQPACLQATVDAHCDSIGDSHNTCETHPTYHGSYSALPRVSTWPGNINCICIQPKRAIGPHRCREAFISQLVREQDCTASLLGVAHEKKVAMAELDQVFYRSLHTAARINADGRGISYWFTYIEEDRRNATCQNKLACCLIVFRGNNGDTGDASPQ